MMSSEVESCTNGALSRSADSLPAAQAADVGRHVHFEARCPTRGSSFSRRNNHTNHHPVGTNSGGRRKRSHSFSWGSDPNMGGSRSKRRRTHHGASTSKFLMGGNINDPLNLGALSPKRNDQQRGVAVPVVIPANINDPLNLNFDAPSDSEDAPPPAAIAYVPNTASKRTLPAGGDTSSRRRRKSKRRRRRYSEPGSGRAKDADLNHPPSFLLAGDQQAEPPSGGGDVALALNPDESCFEDGAAGPHQFSHLKDRSSSVDNPNAKVVFGSKPALRRPAGGPGARAPCSGPSKMGKSLSASLLETASLHQEASAAESDGTNDVTEEDSELDRSPSKLVVVLERDSSLHEESLTEGDSDVSLGRVRSTSAIPKSLKLPVGNIDPSPSKLRSPSPATPGPSFCSGHPAKRRSWDASTPGPSGQQIVSPVPGRVPSVVKFNYNRSNSKNDENHNIASRKQPKIQKQQQQLPQAEQQQQQMKAAASKSGNKKIFQYGNYFQYYGYRNPQHNTDPRLAFFNPRWFDGRDVLDVGCNIGHVTLTIARDFNPRAVTGIDIDKKLINMAAKNVRHYLNKGKDVASDFPKSFGVMYGPLPCVRDLKEQTAVSKLPPEERGEYLQRLKKRKKIFPHNVTFRKANYVPETEELLEMVRPQYDVILCLSVTKWVHLNWGDDGLKRFLRRTFLNLRPGGRLVLEPQPWGSYVKRKKLTPTIFENYKSIRFFPDMFEDFLLREVGFVDCHTVATPTHSARGFQRPIQVYTKDGDPSTELADPEYVSVPRLHQTDTPAHEGGRCATDASRELRYPLQRNYPTHCLGFRERFQFASPYPSPFPSPHPGPSSVSPAQVVSGSQQVSPDYVSPMYAPSSSPYAPSSPQHSPSSPSYVPQPHYDPSHPSSPGDSSPSSPTYAPSSPRYCAASPTYGPTSPSYSPVYPVAPSPMYAPSSPSGRRAYNFAPTSNQGSPQHSPSWPSSPYASLSPSQSNSQDYDVRGTAPPADGSQWPKFYKRTSGGEETAGPSSSAPPQFTTTYQPSWVLSPGHNSNPSPRPSGLSPSSPSPTAQGDSPNTFASPYPYASPLPSASPRPAASPHSFPSPVPSASQLSSFPPASPHLYSFSATLPTAPQNPSDSPNAAASNASPYLATSSPNRVSPSYSSPNPASSPYQGASPSAAGSPCHGASPNPSSYHPVSPKNFASPNPVPSPYPAVSPSASGSSTPSASPNPASQPPFVSPNLYPSPNPSNSPNPYPSPHPSVSPNVHSSASPNPQASPHCFASPHPSASPRPSSYGSARPNPQGATSAVPSTSPQSSASPRPAASPYPSTSASPQQTHLYCSAPFSSSSPQPSSFSPHPSSSSPHPSSSSPHPSSSSPHPSSSSPHPSSSSPHPSSFSPYPSSSSPHGASYSPHQPSFSPHPSSSSPHPSSFSPHTASPSPRPCSASPSGTSPAQGSSLGTTSASTYHAGGPHLYSSPVCLPADPPPEISSMEPPPPQPPVFLTAPILGGGRGGGGCAGVQGEARAVASDAAQAADKGDEVDYGETNGRVGERDDVEMKDDVEEKDNVEDKDDIEEKENDNERKDNDNERKDNDNEEDNEIGRKDDQVEGRDAGVAEKDSYVSETDGIQERGSQVEERVSHDETVPVQERNTSAEEKDDDDIGEKDDHVEATDEVNDASEEDGTEVKGQDVTNDIEEPEEFERRNDVQTVKDDNVENDLSDSDEKQMIDCDQQNFEKPNATAGAEDNVIEVKSNAADAESLDEVESDAPLQFGTNATRASATGESNSQTASGPNVQSQLSKAVNGGAVCDRTERDSP